MIVLQLRKAEHRVRSYLLIHFRFRKSDSEFFDVVHARFRIILARDPVKGCAFEKIVCILVGVFLRGYRRRELLIGRIGWLRLFLDRVKSLATLNGITEYPRV